MRRVLASRHALSIGVAVSLLWGCGESQPSISASATTPQERERTGVHRMTTSSYRVVYSFRYTRDGGRPAGSLIDVNGKLYGTTEFGGGGACAIFGGTGCGSVYRLDPKSGLKKTLYDFRGGASDGAYPVGGLIDVNGTLYGTTTYGGGGCGTYGCGTVFSISTTGTETMLHSFDNTSDGTTPFAPLIDVNGTLYGTTERGGGGSCGCGAVYTISTSGSEKVLYAFRASSDGEYPAAGLIDVNGALYGTTLVGGSSGFGTVYSITTTGSEKVLHSFRNSPDGAQPTAGLIDVKGTLYGTASEGGRTGCVETSYTGCGVVYSITTTGKEKVLYSFVPTNDGAYDPSVGLIDVKGIMYGTAAEAGNGLGCSQLGCGIVYSVTTAGQEASLHVFNGGSDGAYPDAALVEVGGALYGTTSNGGAENCKFYAQGDLGCGTVFALTP